MCEVTDGVPSCLVYCSVCESVAYLGQTASFSFLTRECAHAHERVIAMMVFSLGRLLRRLVGSVVNFRACAVNEF